MGTIKQRVSVVGGGLAGLTAATYLARAGFDVTVLEKSRATGGRARTHQQGGFSFNQGPHALYRGGDGVKVLGELGINFQGGVVKPTVYVARDNRLYAFPKDLLGGGLFNWRGKLALFQAFRAINRAVPARAANQSVTDWLEQNCSQPAVRDLFLMLNRVGTYTNSPTQTSAELFLSQTQMSLKSSVYYLDGGWQTLVDGLSQAARQAGARIVEGARVERLVLGQGAVSAVELADGTRQEAEAVVLVVDPTTAASLVDQPVLRGWAEAARPVYATCLTVALRRLPHPKRKLVFGIDQPLYLSVHSAYARLGTDGAAVVHLLKYLPDGEAGSPQEAEREMENLVDQAQPGWRAELLERQFLPRMVVANALPTVAGGGLAGRPGPRVPGLANLYVAGDWVGPSGWLADASFASARAAARLIEEQSSQSVLTGSLAVGV